MLLLCKTELQRGFRSRRCLPVAVGILIARYPPHKSVRALLRIRLPPWMCGVEACHRIRMQNAGKRNPSVEERIEPLPTHIAALTATDQYHPPQSAKPMPEDFQLRQVSRNGVIAVVTQNDLLQPLTNDRFRLVPTEDQLCLDGQ